MSARRIQRLNSLLKEVIADVLLKDVKNPHLHQMLTITHVDVSKDIRYAKVHVSILGNAEEKQVALALLRKSAGFIAVKASEQVILRYFPQLLFVLDSALDAHMRVQELLSTIQTEREARASADEHPA